MKVLNGVDHSLQNSSLYSSGQTSRKSTSVHYDKLQEALRISLEKLSSYPPNDFYNADVCGLQFRLAPSTSIATEQLCGA